MLLMQPHQDGVMRRLCVIGIPTYTRRPFLDLMCKWETCSGVEWTIKRLKTLKLALIRHMAGLPLLPESYIALNRKREVKGTIGSLFRWAEKSDKNFSKCVQAFMAYTYYILPRLSESQKEKFLGAISPEVTDDGLPSSFHREFSKTVRRTVAKRRVTRCPRPLVTYQGSPDKKAPVMFGRPSVNQDERILDDLQVFNTSGGRSLYCQHSRLYEPLMLACKDRLKHLNWVRENASSRPRSDYSVHGGEIHFLQEPGGKLRSVASPLRIHQEALRPLGEELYDVAASLPWDCTFQQEKAIPFIKSHLWQGGQVFSVDLSSATDFFPLSLQITALRAIVHNKDWDHIDLFQKISRGTWNSEIGTLSWTKGQPLGLYPSFAAFTLTHGLLLRHLAGTYRDQFFVVGDDVIILERDLYEKYIAMLDKMSCPYSIDKTLVSNRLAEFAGKIVTSTMVIPQYKWRRMSDDNFLDICRLLGRKSYCLLSRRQKSVYREVANLCDPIGLNFSLPGDNLAKMVQRTTDFYSPIEVVLGARMGLGKMLNRLVYTSTESLDADALRELSATFDEKVKSVMCQTVYSNWKILNSIGLDGFDTLPMALGLSPRLPYLGFQANRLSTLNRYERLISHKDKP